MKKIFVLPPHMNKRLLSTLMSSETIDSTKNKSFSLKCTSEFASRSGNIFGKLQTLEKNHESWMSENPSLEPVERTENPIGVQSDSEIFKKPFPANRWKQKSSTASPIKRRPQKKWKKYSLEDIPITSDAKNSAIALQCIYELRMRKEKAVDTSDNTEKILFCKPKHEERNAFAQGIVQGIGQGIGRFASCNANKNIQAMNSPLRKKITLERQKDDETKPSDIKLDHLQEDDSDSI